MGDERENRSTKSVARWYKTWKKFPSLTAIGGCNVSVRYRTEDRARIRGDEVCERNEPLLLTSSSEESILGSSIGEAGLGKQDVCACNKLQGSGHQRDTAVDRQAETPPVPNQ